MGINLEILVEGEAFDLFEGEAERFYISKQIFDLRNLETRNAEFSRSVNLPLSPTNLRLLGSQVPTKDRFDVLPHTIIECEVRMSGIPVITDSYLIVGVEDITNKSVSITVYGGTAKFFNELETASIKDLDWSDLNMTWDLTGINAIRNATQIGIGIQYGNAQWYSNPSRRLYEFSGNSNDAETFLEQQEIGETGFFIPIKEICTRIFNNMDILQIDQSNLDHNPNTTDFDSLYRLSTLACPVDVVHTSFQAIDGTLSEAQPEAELFGGLNPDPIRLQMTEILDPDGIFDDASNQFIFTDSGFFSIGLTVNGDHRRSLNLSFQIIANRGLGSERLLTEIFVPPTSGSNIQSYTASGTTSINAEAGDTIGAYIQLDSGTQYSVNVFASGEFTAEQSGADRGRDILVKDYIPDIPQREFVKNVFNWLGIVPSEVNNVVTLDWFEEIRKTKSNAKTLQIDHSRPVKAITTFPLYGQLNLLNYTIPDSLERSDVNSDFKINSLTLRKEAVAIEVLFNPCDQAVSQEGVQTDRCCIPAYELDWQYVTDNKMKFTAGSNVYGPTADRNDIQAGDFISWDTGGGVFVKRRVVIVSDDFSGQMDDVSPTNNDDINWHHWRYDANDVPVTIAQIEGGHASDVTLTDGGFSLPASGTATAFFSNRALWTDIKSTYFPLLLDSVFKPFVIEAWIVIPAVGFAGLRLNEVVFLEDYDAYFYINIIDQWKNNGLCRVTFVQLEL